MLVEHQWVRPKQPKDDVGRAAIRPGKERTVGLQGAVSAFQEAAGIVRALSDPKLPYKPYRP